VVGSEREGLSPEISRRCDRLWTIPLAGAESLNVAAAAAIALGRISSAARGEGH
jgi:tRNA G18 (ribose-2'-O)-methylase SpoU